MPNNYIILYLLEFIVNYLFIILSGRAAAALPLVVPENPLLQQISSTPSVKRHRFAGFLFVFDIF